MSDRAIGGFFGGMLSLCIATVLGMFLAPNASGIEVTAVGIGAFVIGAMIGYLVTEPRSW